MQKITVGGKDYPLKITTRAIMNMEEELGVQPLNIILKVKQQYELPKTTDLMIMLHYALLPLNYGLSRDDVIKLYDQLCEETGRGLELVLEPLLMAFKESGFIKFGEEDPNV